jgi:hypothetical protein
MKNKKAGLTSKLVLFTLLVFFAQVLLFRDVISTYYPTEDEFALIVNSTDIHGNLDAGEWFTVGFAKYFMVYPEWTPYYQNILRPAVNIVYFVNSLIFRDYYGFYLLFSYFLNGLAFSLVYCISRRVLNISENYSILAGIIFLFNPGLLGKFYFYPSFAFDLMAAVFAGCVLVLTLKKKYYWALGLSILGLFIKETLIFLPAVLALSYSIIEKKEKRDPNYIFAGTLFLLPVLSWLIVRFSFGFVFEGASYTEHFSSIRYFGATVVQSVLSWPLGIPDRVDVISNFKSVTAMDFALVNWFYLLASFFNLCMNALIVYFIFKFIKDKQYVEVKTGFVIVLLWVLVYYFLLILLGLETRFGEIHYLLLIPIIICIIKAGASELLKKLLYIFLLIYAINGFAGYFSILGSEMNYYNAKFSISKQLVNNLLVSNKTNERTLLVNDISAGFGSQYLPGFIGSQKDVIKINSIKFDDPNVMISEGFSIKTNNNSDSIQLKVTLPPGTSFQFEGIDIKLIEHKEGEWIKRNDKIWYRFPNEKLIGVSQSTGAFNYDFGNVMEVKYMVEGPTGVIYYNPSKAAYEFEFINYNSK